MVALCKCQQKFAPIAPLCRATLLLEITDYRNAWRSRWMNECAVAAECTMEVIGGSALDVPKILPQASCSHAHSHTNTLTLSTDSNRMEVKSFCNQIPTLKMRR